jgi:8-oxo-dGTP pyrophosphatase MutT (NUDIX family)
VKIFLNEKYIEFMPLGTQIPRVNSTLYLKYEEPETLRSAYLELESGSGLEHLVAGCPDVETAFAEFQKMFALIEAAGGLVENEKGEFLLMFRRGKWDLPKGKLDKGETISQAALREVQEECGISGLSITGELSPTWHIYEQNGKKILKRTHWFRMKCTDTRPLVPQTSEGITEVKWMKKEDALKAFEDSYGSIKEFAIKAISTT